VFVTGAATASLLGAALAESSGGAASTLIVLATVSFLLSVSAGGAWAIWRGRGPVDAQVERAETVSKLAHELKNPLMAIRGLASTAVRLFEQMSDDERSEFFRLIDEEAARLQRVAEQSATAMKVDAGALRYDLRDEDLGALVEEVAWATARGEHPIGVETRPGIGVRADRLHLSEAIANLIDNAAKFSPPDAPIEVGLHRGPDGTAVIEIADRGPGIPDERMEEIFRRFARWRPAGYVETPGAGLGLFITRAHVDAHGGKVDVVPREDGGTILRVTLPTQGKGSG